MSNYHVIIGRNEQIDLIGMAQDVPAKVDSGAFRSAIHATDVKVASMDGKKTLTATLLGHPCYPETFEFSTTKFARVEVINSFGQREARYEVNLKVKVGPKIFLTSFALADRRHNLFPVLLGRQLLKGRFVVDVSKSNVDRVKLKNQFGVKGQLDEDEIGD